MSTITFEKASPKHQKAIFRWLKEPHIKEFWDNSPEHREDIKIFIGGRQIPSSYFEGIISYWVGMTNNEAYCLIMVHEEKDTSDLPEHCRPYLSKVGKTFGLDFCIGSRQHLGKGLAAPTLVSFMEYFTKQVEPQADTFLIDPSLNNPKAIHIYRKAGFETMCEFTQEGGYFDQSKGLLMARLASVGR